MPDTDEIAAGDDRPVWILQAEVGESPLRDDAGTTVSPTCLGLSERLVIAIEDWSTFFGEAGGVISGPDVDPEITEEFVGQGFKIAHRLRSELKGRTVRFIHPVSRQSIAISPRRDS